MYTDETVDTAAGDGSTFEFDEDYGGATRGTLGYIRE